MSANPKPISVIQDEGEKQLTRPKYKPKKKKMVMAQALVDGKVVEVEMAAEDIVYNQQVKNPMTKSNIVYPPLILNRRVQQNEKAKGYFDMSTKEKEKLAMEEMGRYRPSSTGKNYTGWAAKLRRD